MLRDKHDRNLKILLIAVSLLATLWVQAPRLADPFRVDEDFRHVYWMNKFQEQDLFPDDRLLGQTRPTVPRSLSGGPPLDFSSLGYSLLVYGASFVVAPTLASKLLPLLLMPVTVWYLLMYGLSLGRRSVAIALAAGFVFLNLASSTSLSIASGLQRGFACSLMTALLYYLHRRKSLAAAATVFVSALIYPPVFLLSAATSGLFFLAIAVESPAGLKIAREGLVALVVAFCVGTLVISPVVIDAVDGDFEKTVFYDGQVLTHPRYQAGGRNPLFTLFPVIGLGGLVIKSDTALHLIILIFISALISAVQIRRRSLRLPREITCMALGSLGLFAAAWASAFVSGSFLLYQPSRYSRVGLFLFFSLFVLLNIGDAVKEGVRLIHEDRNATTWLVGGIEAVALALILLYPSSRTQLLGINMKWPLAGASALLGVLGVLSLGGRSAPAVVANPAQTPLARILIGLSVAICLVGWRAYAGAATRAYTLNPSPAERELLAFLETLPKDVLLAGTPCLLDNIPLFAKRQILFSCEHVSGDEDLMREALDAYYTEEPDTVVEFCRAHGVDYLVINRHTYTQEYIDQGWIFFEPYNQEILARVRARDSFALAEVPESAKAFESGELFVVPCTASALDG